MTQPPQAHLPRSVHHEPPAHAPNAALMIDFDNVTMGIRSDLQSELRRLLQSDIIKGKVAVQRAYADWRRYPQYIVPLAESSIDMIWAPAYGSYKKNATDIRLAIDALELVFTRPEIGTFILLSGDSDFSSLVLKLKEYGKYVIGVGIRESSSDLLIQNCDEYYSYNELAGLTKESDVTHPRHDPWDLVIEAVKQMTAHSDVMRSDRLKQVMQEIDPAFNEKDLGFSRFSKFVIEAAHKGLITLTKLDNGQYEIGLGPGVPGAAAQPAGMAAFDRPRERERGEGRGRGRGRGRGGRDEREAREEHAVPAAEEPAALPPAREDRRSAFSLDGAFGLIKQAIGRLGGESRPVRAQELGEAMAEIKGAEAPGEPAQVQKLLRQAHDRDLIDLAKEDDGAYTVKLRDATPSPETPQAEPAAMTDPDEALDPPMPESSAPPSMRPANVPAGIPSRSARFRRGSCGPRVAPPEIPKIGVVEMDPNFKPRIELVPPKQPPAAAVPEPLGGERAPTGAPAGDDERPERGTRGRGGRGRRGGGGGGGSGASSRDDRADVGERPERGERGERGARGRRGGRGRGGRGRGTGAEGRAERGDRIGGDRVEPRDAPEPRAARAEPAPPPAPKPPAREPDADSGGESFWSKVKRGLTGGT